MTSPAAEGTTGARETPVCARPAQDNDPTPGIPCELRRRRVAAWHCEPLAGGRRDPWTDERPAGWSTAEIVAWQRAAEHLLAHQLYGRWQVPESVRESWHRGGDAA